MSDLRLTSEEFEKLIKEGNEFYELRRKFRQSSNPDAGKPGYLISTSWVLKYKKYVFYDKIARNQTPTAPNEVHEPPG